MATYLLDTNTISLLIRGNHAIAKRLQEQAMIDIALSAVTEGELLFGLARRPQAMALHQAVKAFIQRTQVLPWDSSCAAVYGRERAKLQSEGLSLSALDMMIAAHAKAVDAVLVTHDQSMLNLSGWKTQDWAR
ncbi:MAG: type II toxin-antitoxin system VapC family toxin [Betaproteobacteria bacterium]|nr:type II toxin-antitoxin system VapC family toxin [Betaproteobacteria bacterium]NBY33292.1 type II toxin-antitoxin system VapC family toxin [Betaproteobacteria bacterium]